MELDPLVVCLGEAIVDRLGPPGGNPAIDQPIEDCLGGAPANVACALSRLGTSVAFAGRVGKDEIGESFCKLFAERGVGTALLQRDGKRPCRIVLVRRSHNGEREFQDFAGNTGDGFADEALESICVPMARWLLIGTLPLATPTSASALLSAVRQARHRGSSIALDINWRPTFWNAMAHPGAGPWAEAKAVIRPLLHRASLIKFSREEALWFFDTDDPGEIHLALPQRPDVVVTDGAAPVKWQLGTNSGQQPALTPPNVVDTTGAGDAFMAGLLHRWEDSPYQRIRFATACGALVCAGKGGIDPQPTQTQVMDFLGEVS